MQRVKAFFEEISDEYTAALARCVPRYDEMLWALLTYLPAELEPRSILELGCGTGNLSLLLRRRFPAARLTVVDLSPSLLEQCRARLGSTSDVRFLQADFAQLAEPPASHDLVASSIALHHLPHDGQRALFARVAALLRPGGVIAYCDQFAGATDEIYRQHMALWREQTLALGATEAEWTLWMEHQQRDDHHAPLPAQLSWLAEAGFEGIDCVWRYVLWTVVLATRGGAAARGAARIG